MAANKYANQIPGPIMPAANEGRTKSPDPSIAESEMIITPMSPILLSIFPEKMFIASPKPSSILLMALLMMPVNSGLVLDEMFSLPKMVQFEYVLRHHHDR